MCSQCNVANAMHPFAVNFIPFNKDAQMALFAPILLKKILVTMLCTKD